MPSRHRVPSRTALLALTATSVVAALVLPASASSAAPKDPAASATASAPSAKTLALKPDRLAAAAAQALVAAKSPQLHLSARDAVVAAPVISTREGLQYAPYTRTYAGLPVYGGDFVVVTDARGAVLSTSVQQTETIAVSTRPTVSATTAAGTTNRVACLRDGKASAPLSTTSPRAVVYAIGRPRLAWEVVATCAPTRGVPSVQHVFLDAGTAGVLHRYDEVAEGTGTSAWNGPNPVTIDTRLSGATYSMTDPVRQGISCRNNANNTVLTGPDDLWGNGNATSIETGCVDALFDVATEYRMLSSWLGRNGITAAGSGFPINVGLNDQNAFYDGTKVVIGKNTAGQWISSLDVVAHEFGHGIDDNTPGGISGGGTQEFVADVFGALTEWYANEPSTFDAPDFLVGERINLVGSGPIRNMYNPSALGDPNCYSSAIPGTEVHAAAGPGNHWFYLLSQGTNPTDGQPVSPTCNGTTLSGIGIQTAGKIFYNAMLSKTTGFTYLKYRTATLNAAKALFPTDPSKCQAVKAAWDAVSVPAQTADPACGTLAVTNPGSQTTVVNTAVSLQLAATESPLVAPLTFSATGLPAGLTVSTSGLVSGRPTTAGTSTVVVTVRDGAGLTASTSFLWSVTPVGGTCVPAQLLANPGFESGSTPWTATAGVLNTTTAGQPAHGGTRLAWLDGYGTTHTDSIAQTVTIPAGCRATLSFWLHIDSAETTTTVQYDKLVVTAGTTTVATFSNLNKAAGYTLRTVDLSAFAGTTVTLKWTGTEDSSLQTSFVVDDTSLTTS